jgi:nitroimidazol reductase NimA-like FMN-containing flavoprotein (pyridoxamine 5'-phosphate oxidase superfamily)
VVIMGEEVLVGVDDSRATTPSAPHDLGPFTHDECLQLLESATMGRVGWAAGGRQHILPVSCATYDGKLVFRTSPHGELANLELGVDVAFEIDEVDHLTGTGWSVVVQGVAEAVVLRRELEVLRARRDIVPWAPEPRGVYIAIAQQSVSGRRVEAPFYN